jgi:hypothetical protein
LGLRARVELDFCQEQCGFVFFTGDSQEVRSRVPAEIKGWPVCVEEDRGAFTGYDPAPGIRVGPPANQ